MSVVDLKKPADAEEPAPTKFSHVKEGDTQFHGDGLRDFFEYRDLGIADATNGKVIAHLVRAKKSAGRRHRLASAHRRLPDRADDQGMGALHV
ncbi:protein of unknown function [Methylocella tundrae]|uniref:Uncharacterized protein n=1 Tax=Methylocella tundrae TaxID=227605 RepID=A0A4U8YW82_METTU|nr:protein of unknown function [Methylocella tundrae]